MDQKKRYRPEEREWTRGKGYGTKEPKEWVWVRAWI